MKAARKRWRPTTNSVLEDLCEGPHMQKAVRTAEEVIGKFWAAGQEGQAAPIRWASSPVNGSSWLIG